jgi:hypothetical protein
MGLKIPKTLAVCADLYYKKREERLAMQKQVDALEEDEKALKEHLIQSIPKSKATGIAGKLCSVSVVTKDVPRVEDWEKFYDYNAKNKKHGSFALLNRAPNAKAVNEIWESGKQIPGIEKFTAVTLSVSKV